MQNQYLYHYGVKGMRWGVRRYQRADGTLTPAGRKRLVKEQQKVMAKDLEQTIEKANKNVTTEFDDGKDGYSAYIYRTSKAMKEIDKKLNKAYTERNKIYDTSDDDMEYYDAGAKFRQQAEKAVDDVLGKYGKTHVKNLHYDEYMSIREICMNAIETSDWHDIGNGRYNERAWVYWH